MTFEEYLDYCDEVLEQYVGKRLQFQYYKKANKKRGLVAIYQENDGNHVVTYSLCSKLDEFDREHRSGKSSYQRR